MTQPGTHLSVDIEAITQGLCQADRLREFVTDEAGTEHGAGHAVFGDLMAIDDMVSDLERVRDGMAREPHRPLSPERAKSVAASLQRLRRWTDAVSRGTARPGQLQQLDVE